MSIDANIISVMNVGDSLKVGIVTWYGGNYGSALQAFALQEAIEEAGHEAVLIRHDIDEGVLQVLSNKVREDGISGTGRFLFNYLRAEIEKQRIKEEFNVRQNAFRRFTEEHLSLTKRLYKSSDYQESASEADCFVCGSDQIWNPLCTHFSPFYWLNFLPRDIPKFSYAPSMGSKPLSNQEVKTVRQMLEGYISISVREKSSAAILDSVLCDPCGVTTVVDPTLLLSKEKWEQLVEGRIEAFKGEHPYVFAYILRGNNAQRSLVKRLAKDRNLSIITYPNLEHLPRRKDADDFGDLRIFTDDPFDFVARIHESEFVITDSFHASVFSILFGKEFLVLQKTGDNNHQIARIENLLAMFGMSERLVKEDDPAALNNKSLASCCTFAQERDVSRKYLINALNKCCVQIGLSSQYSKSCGGIWA